MHNDAAVILLQFTGAYFSSEFHFRVSIPILDLILHTTDQFPSK